MLPVAVVLLYAWISCCVVVVWGAPAPPPPAFWNFSVPMQVQALAVDSDHNWVYVSGPALNSSQQLMRCNVQDGSDPIFFAPNQAVTGLAVHPRGSGVLLSDGEMLVLAGVGRQPITYPGPIDRHLNLRQAAYDDEDNVYATDFDPGNRVARFDRQGRVKLLFDGMNPSLQHPWGVAIDRKQGLVFVTDENGRLLRFTPRGVQTAVLIDSLTVLDRPTGMAIDRLGHLYVVDSGRSQVVKVDQMGRVLAMFPPANTTTLRTVYSVAVDDRLNVYVGDFDNTAQDYGGRIVVFAQLDGLPRRTLRVG